MTFLAYIALVTVATALAFALGRWASRGSKTRRNAVGFLVAAAGAYAAGFSADMLVGGVAGEIPWRNLAMPVLTWSVAAVVLARAALISRGSRFSLTLPYVANAAIALSAAVVNPRHFVVVAFLIVLGVAIFSLCRLRDMGDALQAKSGAA